MSVARVSSYGDGSAESVITDHAGHEDRPRDETLASGVSEAQRKRCTSEGFYGVNNWPGWCRYIIALMAAQRAGPGRAGLGTGWRVRVGPDPTAWH